MKQNTHKKQGHTIFTQLILLLVAVLLIQLGIYFVVFLGGNILGETRANAFDILNEKTSGRKVYLENEMIQRWSKTEACAGEVGKIIRGQAQQYGITEEAVLKDSERCQTVLTQSASNMISMLRSNSVTGAFLILNAPTEDGTSASYPGFYVRDYDPATYSPSNADLLLERGLPSIAQSMNIPMDSFWSSSFTFQDPSDDSARFFYAPLEAAEDVPAENRDSRYFAYWSSAFHMSDMDRNIITYSIPLLSEQGEVLAVLGVDITLDYLASQLKYDELASGKAGAYLLGITRDGGLTYEPVVSSGPVYQAYFSNASVITTVPYDYNNIVKLDAKSKTDLTIYASAQPLKLYDVNTPFVQNQWVLIGILDDSNLLSFSYRVQGLFLAALLLASAIGIVMIFIAAKATTSPITNLIEDLRQSDPTKPIRLNRVKLNEIDTLTTVIEDLSSRAAEAAARTSKIINMANLPVGVYEYYEKEELVFCSRTLFLVLGWEDVPENDTYILLSEFRKRMENTLAKPYDADKDIYHLQKQDSDVYVRLFYKTEGELFLGAFMDVTRNIKAQQQLAYERDYDILTNIYNRRALDGRIEALFRDHKDELKVAALIMFDLDNLKFVNDSYGHDSGDRYIKTFADRLNCFSKYKNTLIGRRSGDEFNVFLYGYETREEIKACIDEAWSELSETYIDMPDGVTLRVRASGGMAWYPDDSDNYSELLRLSDFAMYHIKHTVKGMIYEFEAESYKEKSILIWGQDDLNRFLENRLVRYAFQPIISAVTGEVYGYEMLMRPLIEPLANLETLFRLAKSQSKLYQMEQLTWFEALEAFTHQIRIGNIGSEEHIFIKSIGNQILTQTDLEYLTAQYKNLLPRIIMELTESEEFGSEIIHAKQKIVSQWGAQIAIDDFGTGFNSETVLIHVNPDLVKVDISIIHDIDHDDDRHALLTNLISYAKDRNIKVLAEGVETKAELLTLIECGVDYLQGFYIAKADFDIPRIPGQVIREIREKNKPVSQ